jgi:hypothetical protein
MENLVAELINQIELSLRAEFTAGHCLPFALSFLVILAPTIMFTQKMWFSFILHPGLFSHWEFPFDTLDSLLFSSWERVTAVIVWAAVY